MLAKLLHDLLLALGFWNVSHKQAQVRHADIHFQCFPLLYFVVVELWKEDF